MRIYYSPSTLGFYSTDLYSGTIPGDALEITAEKHQELLTAQASGREIRPGDGGLPESIELLAPPLTWDEIRTQRNALLTASDFTQGADARRRMGGEKAAAWDAYRQALADIPETFQAPMEVQWPVKP